MARWETHQTDANAEAIYADARKLGFSVEKLNRPVDALFGIYDQTVAVEVKTKDGKLEPSQVKFFKMFKGLKRIVRHTGDVLDLYREMRDRHDALFPKPVRGGQHGEEGSQDAQTREAAQGRQGPGATLDAYGPQQAGGLGKATQSTVSAPAGDGAGQRSAPRLPVRGSRRVAR